MRLRGFPFATEVSEFIENHDHVFVIEQNRDGQMRSLLINELGTFPDKLFSITNIDAMPVTATHILDAIGEIIESIPGVKTPEGGA